VSPLIQADDEGDLGRLQVLQEPQVTPHGSVAHDVLERLDGPRVTSVGYRLPSRRGWPAPDGGRPKQKPKAPRLPHVFGLPSLGSFHLGGVEQDKLGLLPKQPPQDRPGVHAGLRRTVGYAIV
jgi:hypothetical protein